MRILRHTYGKVWYPHHPHHLDRPEVINFTGESTTETRILFNRFETKLIDGILWAWDTWLIYPIQRLACHWFGKHSRACRGRMGHY